MQDIEREMIEAIINVIRRWEAVEVVTHRFGGQDLRFGNVAIGHIHVNEMVVMPLTRNARGK
jgi:hypothetical protein